jgi:hypothetical protein
MTDDLKNKSKEEIMKFALNELKQAIQLVGKGKTPTISNKLKNAFKTLSETYKMVEEKKLSEEDMDKVLIETAKEVNTKDK